APDAPTDRVIACNDWAALGGAAITAFLDNRGEPITAPRFLSSMRQGWPSTVVTKYTASSQNEGHGISQLFHTSASFIDGSKETKPVTWFSKTDQDAKDCGGTGWCQWSYNPVTHTLCKKDNATPGVQSTVAGDGTCTDGGSPVIEALWIDGLLGIGNDGKVVATHTLSKFEKSPVVIYQKLGQFVEMDTDAAHSNQGFIVGTDPNVRNPTFTHNEGPGDLEQSGQAIWYEFWGLSGPNVRPEVAQDPYTFWICGTRDEDHGEQDCAAGEGGIGGIDSPNRLVWAIVDPNGQPLGGLDPLQRYGADLRPSTGTTCPTTRVNGDAVADPSICGQKDVMVICADPTACPSGFTCDSTDADNNFLLTKIATGEDFQANRCLSEPGTTDFTYGTADDGTVYYREALNDEETIDGGLLRTFARDERHTAFS
ncbi:MAG: hypothetical protein ACREIQ_02025, partial [Nitrospiria bacterium]